MTPDSRLVRAVLMGTIAVTVLLAGCLGGRRGRPPAPLPADRDTLADTTGVRDTVAIPDSLARADSARRDSVAQAARDSLGGDSLVRDTTDTTARAADTTRRTPPPPARPTTRECVLDFTDSPPESRLVTNLLNDGTRTTFIGGGLVVRCQGDPQVVSADSAEQYENAGMLVLIGNVVFDEPGKTRVTAPTATYFTGEEKLVLYGGVLGTDVPTGSTFSGPTAEYYRAGRMRPFARLYAPQRPTMRLVQRDSAGEELPPVSVTANQFEYVGDTVLVGWGSVLIDRQQITGQSDSATFDQRTERARLIRNAFIMSRDTTRAFRLTGDSIDLFSTDRVLERVVAMHRAQAISSDVTMRAERVEMRLDSQQVDRAWAYGPGRAYAETTTQSLEADSIEVVMPGQVVQTLHAIGQALAFGVPDTTRIRNAERDVLSGDTIVAAFDTVTTPPDTTPKSVIRQVTATLRASAQYQMASSGGPDCPPSINYVRGRRIVVDFDSGAVQSVSVDSQASGVYLEPVPDSLADGGRRLQCGPPADSATADSLRRDSLRRDSIRRDSTRPDTVPPDTIPPSVSAIASPSSRTPLRSLPFEFSTRSAPFDVPRRRQAFARTGSSEQPFRIDFPRDD